jgi:hypothetical protein
MGKGEPKDFSSKEGGSAKGAPSQVPWTPQDVNALLDKLIPFVDRYLKLIESKQKFDTKLSEVEAGFQTRLAVILLTFTGGIIIALVYLAWVGVVGGDALLFVIGIVIGALFTMIQRLMRRGVVIETGEEEV